MGGRSLFSETLAGNRFLLLPSGPISRSRPANL